MEEKIQKGLNILKKELKKCPFSDATLHSNAYCLRGFKLERGMIGEAIYNGEFNTVEEFLSYIEKGKLGQNALEVIPCRAWDSESGNFCKLIGKN